MTTSASLGNNEPPPLSPPPNTHTYNHHPLRLRAPPTPPLTIPRHLFNLAPVTSYQLENKWRVGIGDRSPRKAQVRALDR